MRVTVRLFAKLRDVIGTGELLREVPEPATAHAVWNAMVAEWPALREYEKTMSVAVNAEYSRMTASVHDGDEVAFMPPVSGGSSTCTANRAGSPARA
jgi:molybdopterin converting factor subunit 1